MGVKAKAALLGLTYVGSQLFSGTGHDARKDAAKDLDHSIADASMVYNEELKNPDFSQYLLEIGVSPNGEKIAFMNGGFQILYPNLTDAQKLALIDSFADENGGWIDPADTKKDKFPLNPRDEGIDDAINSYKNDKVKSFGPVMVASAALPGDSKDNPMYPTPSHPDKKVGAGGWGDYFNDIIRGTFGGLNDLLEDLLNLRKEYGEQPTSKAIPPANPRVTPNPCDDPIYRAGADECKTASADSPQNALGGAPGGTGTPTTGNAGFDAGVVYKEIASNGYFGERKWKDDSWFIKKYGREARSNAIGSIALGHKDNDVFVKVKLKDGKRFEDIIDLATGEPLVSTVSTGGKSTKKVKGALQMGFDLKKGNKYGEQVWVAFTCDTDNVCFVAKSNPNAVYNYSADNTIRLRINDVYDLLDPNGSVYFQADIGSAVPFGEALDLNGQQ